ncbi:MAG: antitoxin VapB family protein [Nitrososphaerota archaeon]|nr:antitoxin VapB family protein [Nitrososphaerota archaeon]
MTKTLTIKDDVYEKLVAVKDPDESFSDLFVRLVEQGSSVEVLKRMRGKLTFADKRKLLSEISARREEKRA